MKIGDQLWIMLHYLSMAIFWLFSNKVSGIFYDKSHPYDGSYFWSSKALFKLLEWVREKMESLNDEKTEALTAELLNDRKWWEELLSIPEWKWTLLNIEANKLNVHLSSIF